MIHLVAQVLKARRIWGALPFSIEWRMREYSWSGYGKKAAERTRQSVKAGAWHSARRVANYNPRAPLYWIKKEGSMNESTTLTPVVSERDHAQGAADAP